MLCSAIAVNAQTVKEGNILLNAGIGLGTYDADNLSFPALAVSVDYMAQDHLFDDKSSLSLGAYTGFYRQSWKVSYMDLVGRITNATNSTNTFVLGARGGLHYKLVDKLDTYGGLMLGYAKTSYSTNGGSSSDGEFKWGLFIGARYFFTDKIGAFAELGYGVSPIELGVSFKF